MLPRNVLHEGSRKGRTVKHLLNMASFYQGTYCGLSLHQNPEMPTTHFQMHPANNQSEQTDACDPRPCVKQCGFYHKHELRDVNNAASAKTILLWTQPESAGCTEIPQQTVLAALAALEGKSFMASRLWSQRKNQETPALHVPSSKSCLLRFNKSTLATVLEKVPILS